MKKTTKMYTLTSPQQHFKGTVLGGIYVSQLVNQQSKGNDSSKNRAYVGYKNILAYENTDYFETKQPHCSYKIETQKNSLSSK
ncbi:hypothetical protein [Lactiplantibacillus plantarum]|uniref:hypothetical protein n=1 Tax=Lactiplantibacillus plantarum TaxID=1590 RepID=UPI00214BDB3D|nr:hypothetical protein [Lactiplantibacillus plantarum]